MERLIFALALVLCISCQKISVAQPQGQAFQATQEAPVAPPKNSESVGKAASTPSPQEPVAEIASCAADARVMPLEMPAVVEGALHTYRFHMLSTKPQKLTRGTAELKIEVRSSQGVAKEVASLTITPTMPDHGHGSQVVPVVSGGKGVFSVRQVDLFMPGVWRIGVKANNRKGEALETGAFHFCIEG